MLQKVPTPIEQMVEWMRARGVDEAVITVAVQTAEQVAEQAGNPLPGFDLTAPTPRIIRKDFYLWFNETFWPAYPKRWGSNPKKPAADKLFAKIKSGEKPEIVMAGITRYAAELKLQGKLNTQFVMQAVRWINSEGWKDDPMAEGGAGTKTFSDISADLRARAERSEYEQRTHHQRGDQVDFDL